MKREILENYVGKKVRVVFFDDDEAGGVLQRGNDLFTSPKKYYYIKYLWGNHFANGVFFVLSHIKKIEEIK
ncbi:MAG: hypothetical protein M0R51_13510 [Clostridia bacterium]|jgi:hypothetical protein|nr:hypothetical protein [Clostridia bacterium]